MGNLHHLTWKEEQEMLENAFARRLLIEYGIKEVTTQRQAKNGTREFEFPVSTYQGKHNYYRRYVKDLPNTRLRLAVFKSGVVRKQNGTYSPYQLNKQYKQNRRYTYLTEDGLVTRETIGIARALIYSQMARLKYMLEYYLKNYTK